MPMLQEILAELREIHAHLHPRRCTDSDLEALQILLPAIGGKRGSHEFTAAEIMLDPIIAAIAPKKSSVGSIGALFARAAHDKPDIGGLQVERIGKQQNKSLWKVVSKLPQPL